MRLPPRFSEDSRLIERVAADLSAVRDDLFDFRTIQDAPTLRQVSIVKRPMLCLEGIVLGHPRLLDGEAIVTSQYWGAFTASSGIIGHLRPDLVSLVQDRGIH